MLVTNRAKLQGQFLAQDSLRLLWKSASLNPDSCYFVVEGCGLVDGAFGPWIRLVSSVDEVDSLCRGGQVDTLRVNKIQLLAPPEMTKQSGFSMHPLSEIRIKEGSAVSPVYEFVTQNGQIYSSTKG